MQDALMESVVGEGSKRPFLLNGGLLNRCMSKESIYAYFTPIYKMLNEVWKQIVTVLQPVASKKDVQLKQLITLTGGIIDFWSLDNIESVRGRVYHEFIYRRQSNSAL